MSRIVFAYSGSARASIALRWMIEAWQAEVVTLTLDLGQRDELDAVRERALACGAIRAHVLDEREYAEIAREQQASEVAVRQRVSRGLRILREKMR